MNINDRIKYLRKDVLHLTQEEFAPKARISRSNLGSIEIGRTNVTERVKDDICNEFNINREWLEDGIGGDENIFIKITPSEQAYNRFGYLMENSSPSKKAALSMLLELLYILPDDKWELIMKQYNESLNEAEKEES